MNEWLAVIGENKTLKTTKDGLINQRIFFALKAASVNPRKTSLSVMDIIQLAVTI